MAQPTVLSQPLINHVADELTGDPYSGAAAIIANVLEAAMVQHGSMSNVECDTLVALALELQRRDPGVVIEYPDR